MNEFERAILQIVSEHPGIKAREIATKLDCDRATVNSALYGSLRNQCYQDTSYRWYLNTAVNREDAEAYSPEPDKLLSNICKYYLNCLSLEDSKGVSSFLTSKYSLNYAELPSIEVDSSDENIARLIRQVSIERNLTSYVGYPVLIHKFHSVRTNEDFFKVVPILLFPVELNGGAISISSVPHVNIEAIKQYSSLDSESQIYDLIKLEKELGLSDASVDIELDELVARLQNIREWQWKENLDPSVIANNPPINTITEEGIYNKAIFVVTEKSPYTVGLESELSNLAQLDESSYKNTALYDWLHGISSNLETHQDIPLLEVLPMNIEQEQAIYNAISKNLTIVTGPPGTGKSQVVTNLIVNAAWNGKSVLFTSKNNKAVDVVETRVNSLAHRPIMLRCGGNQYAHHLAMLISDLLSSLPNQYDFEEYNIFHNLYNNKVNNYRELKEQKNKVINFRNHADHMEQKACELRDKWEKWFNHISNEDVDNFDSAFEQYFLSYKKWYQTKSSFLGKLFWFILGKKKTENLEESLYKLNKQFKKYEFQIISNSSQTLDIKANKRIVEDCKNISYALQSITEYQDALELLLSSPRLEKIDYDLMNLKSELSEVAIKLWSKWLITQPLNIDTASRREMNEYITAMDLTGDIDLAEYPEIMRQFRRLQQKMTKYMPCWAVTSLSAHGRIPFKPGIFDIVVIDEASQCDIASVLPMLYRAKKAVIIGDPKQLSHISSVSKKQDLSLLQKHEVDFSWSYSTTSLYALASSLASPDEIIQLRDHHRSYGDIIEFSNSEFYDGKLRIATNYSKLKCPKNTDAGIRWVDVVGKTIRPSNGGAYNDAEVTAIATELKRLVIDNNYEGTIGVVTPFKAQAERIRNAIEKNYELRNALQQNDFLVDTVHKFQGDERDLILFSPVISQGTGHNAIGFLNNTGNLFNVAITRARAVLVVVGDSSYCSNCGVSYMEHFVAHVNKTKSRLEREHAYTAEYSTECIYPKVANPEQVSEWEKTFYTALFNKGIKTIPQYAEDKYKLDLAIIDGDRKLDIEVDGEMYHKDWNGELCLRDQMRNQRLFELGWDVKRFWVYQIRDNLQDCIDEVIKWLNN